MPRLGQGDHPRCQRGQHGGVALAVGGERLQVVLATRRGDLAVGDGLIDHTLVALAQLLCARLGARLRGRDGGLVLGPLDDRHTGLGERRRGLLQSRCSGRGFVTLLAVVGTLFERFGGSRQNGLVVGVGIDTEQLGEALIQGCHNGLLSSVDLALLGPRGLVVHQRNSWRRRGLASGIAERRQIEHRCTRGGRIGVRLG
ncbi:Uncharacterised protein [Mycobacteroides abscessus subsp. massiliense]|nr:Uncharacterised protein [Mycobacteroides abscessus subsp. massiliense]